MSRGLHTRLLTQKMQPKTDSSKLLHLHIEYEQRKEKDFNS
jgi:hypothetical protein